VKSKLLAALLILCLLGGTALAGQETGARRGRAPLEEESLRAIPRTFSG